MAPPMITIVDANQYDPPVSQPTGDTGAEPIDYDSIKFEPPLAQSPPLPLNNNNWQDFSLQFTTSSTTTAVVISLQRQLLSVRHQLDEAKVPYPIYGHIWLDKFSLNQ